jgi:hypothetical protein
VPEGPSLTSGQRGVAPVPLGPSLTSGGPSFRWTSGFSLEDGGYACPRWAFTRALMVVQAYLWAFTKGPHR